MSPVIDPRSGGTIGSLQVIADEVPPADNWCLFVGAARTGSSVATWLVNAHPDAVVFNEGWLWGPIELLLREEYHPAGNTGLTPTRACRLLERGGNFYGVPETGWRASFLRGLLEHFRPPGVAMFGDKRHAYLLPQNLPNVERVLPCVRWVATTRNRLDRVASFMAWDYWQTATAGLDREQRLQRTLDVINTSDQRVHDLAARVPVHEFSFERMARQPRDEVAALLEFLGLDTQHYAWRVVEQTRHAQAVGRWRRCDDARWLAQRYPELEEEFMRLTMV